MRTYVALSCLMLSMLSVPGEPAEPKAGTIEAFDAYAAQVRQDFLAADHAGATPPRPGAIVRVPGGLVHHWSSAVVIPDVSLEQVLAVAQDYEHYAAIHTPVLQSQLIERQGNTFRIRVRMKSDAGLLSAVLDSWSVVTYIHTPGGVRTLSETRKIRQLNSEDQPAAPPPAGFSDSKNFWAANTFTSFESVPEGVRVELETLGLSRRFPRMLGWIIEPIARRLGRSSAERTLEEFRAAVVRKHTTDK